jgi:hypothetical protein
LNKNAQAEILLGYQETAEKSFADHEAILRHRLDWFLFVRFLGIKVEIIKARVKKR